MKIGSGPLHCFPAPKLLKCVGCFGLSAGAIQLGRRDHSFTHCLSVASLQNRERDFTTPHDIKKTTERSSYWNIMDRGDIRFRSGVVVKSKDWGQWNAPPESFRNDHVELRGVEVGEIKEGQGGLMTVYALG